MDELIHPARLFRGKDRPPTSKFTHLAGDLHRKGSGIESGYLADAGTAIVMASQASATVLPTGEIAQRPVTTTLRRVKAGLRESYFLG